MPHTKEIPMSIIGMNITAPPTYESPMDGAPPSYKSLFGDIKKAKDESEGNAQFARTACGLCCAVLCGSVIGLVVLVLATAIPVAMIIIGSKYLNNCPAEEYIPIFLVGSGSAALFVFIINILIRARNIIVRLEDKKDAKDFRGLPYLLGLLSCFQLAWFIAGNIWIYRTNGNWSSDLDAENYCHPTLYNFAFWVITGGYIVFGGVLVLIICAGCFLCCCAMCCSGDD